MEVVGSSSLLFWRWGERFGKAALKGFEPWVSGPLPRYFCRAVISLYLDKFKDIANKGYLVAPRPQCHTSDKNWKGLDRQILRLKKELKNLEEDPQRLHTREGMEKRTRN